MRTTDERIAAVLQRAKELTAEDDRAFAAAVDAGAETAAEELRDDAWTPAWADSDIIRRNRILIGAAFAACFVALIGMSFMFASLTGSAPEAVSQSETATIFSDGPGGYILIAVLAFLFGTALTLLCVRLRNKGKI